MLRQVTGYIELMLKDRFITHNSDAYLIFVEIPYEWVIII